MKNKKLFLLGAFLLSFFLSMAQIPAFVPKNETDVFKKNEAEIKKSAEIATGDEIQYLTKKYKLTHAEKNQLYEIINRREQQKVIYNYLYPTQDSLRYGFKSQIDMSFKPELIKFLFVNEKNVNCYNSWILYSNRKAFALSDKQVESIIETVVNINLIKEDETTTNFDQRGYELTAFRKILTNSQFEAYLEAKLYDEVKKEVDNSWKKLKENGLSVDLDSTVEIPVLFRYQMALSKANYLNYNDYGKREKVVKTITDAAPLTARRVNSIPAAQQAKNAYKGSLVW